MVTALTTQARVSELTANGDIGLTFPLALLGRADEMIE
jgi:hypothetical protein